MKRSDLRGMSIDELWELHEQLRLILGKRLSATKEKVEHRIRRLRQNGLAVVAEERSRHRYRKVAPKYRNPENRSETWAGRGKQPRWVSEIVAAGRNLEEFRIP